jgi:hypothetical protein
MRIQISKTHPAVKKLFKPTLRAWRGWVVYVEEVDPSWNYRHDLSRAGAPFTGPVVYRESSDGDFFGQVPATGDRIIADGPAYGDVLIVKETSGPRWHTGAVTIYIPTTLDPAVLDVARDALIDNDKRQSKIVLQALGPYAGIGGAVIEAQVKGFTKVQKGGKPSRQLDREITEFLRQRGS